MSLFPGALVLIILGVLVIAAILMPLYVIQMAGDLRKARKALEKLVWHAENRRE